MLPKKFRNINREYFSAIYSKGKKIRGFYGSMTFLFKIVPGEVASIRFAVTPNKTFGDAVHRNLQKRRASNLLQQVVDTKNMEAIQEALYYKNKNGQLLVVYYLVHEVEPKDLAKLKLEINDQLNAVLNLAAN